MRGLFVVGTDTGVGKTLVSAALLAAAGPAVRYWKPVQSGFPEDDDTATVRRLARAAPKRLLDEGVRLRAPRSPHYAARLEGRRVSLPALFGIAQAHDRRETRWIVEGAGGLRVPLGGRRTIADLVRAFGLPALVVASTRLGTINHTVLTLEALERDGVPTLGVVLTGPADPSAETGIRALRPRVLLARVPPLRPVGPTAVLAAGRRLLRVPAIRRALA